jgi:hypothetical protein
MTSKYTIISLCPVTPVEDPSLIDFEILKTSKSKPLLRVNNYCFLKNKERNGKIYSIYFCIVNGY